MIRFRHRQPPRLAAMTPSRRRNLLIAAIATVALGLALGFQQGLLALKGQVEQALGPGGEIGGITVGWGVVEVVNLRLRAPAGWPAEDALRAERVTVAPDLLGLLTGKPGAHRIIVDRAYVSALRTADGRLRVVPSLTEGMGAKDGGTAPAVSIGTIELRDCAADFFDSSVRQPPLKVRLESLGATIGPLALPDLAGRTDLKLDATIKGIRRDGRLGIAGWMKAASRESDIKATLKGVDLVALQPYLIKAAETGVRKGSLDMDLHSLVQARQLKATGTVSLDGLDLDTGGGTVLGLPRQAAVSLLKDKRERITVQFVLEGNLDDPKFRLNEGLATRFGASLAETLGVSIEGVVQGAAGIGKAIKGLFNGK